MQPHVLGPVTKIIQYIYSAIILYLCPTAVHVCSGVCAAYVGTLKEIWCNRVKLSTETIKELLCISCGLQGPFIFVRRLLNTLLMCFQDAATGFSLKAYTRPNYSHFEVSSMVKTCSHGAATVTYILITHLPESCSRSASDSQRLLCCVAGRVCVLSIYGCEKVSKSKCEVVN